MLAQLAPPIPEIISEMGVAICETKYDGIRLQVHRHVDEIKIFTRRLENITHALPEIVDLFNEYLPHEDYIVEGEVIATRDGKPLSSRISFIGSEENTISMKLWNRFL